MCQDVVVLPPCGDVVHVGIPMPEDEADSFHPCHVVAGEAGTFSIGCLTTHNDIIGVIAAAACSTLPTLCTMRRTRLHASVL